MMVNPFDIEAKPSKLTWAMLSWVLFALGIGLYFQESIKRHRENPEDRVVPTLAQLAQGIHNAFLNPAEEDDDTSVGGGLLGYHFRAAISGMPRIVDGGTGAQ